MGYDTLRLCAGGGAFEAVPRPRQPVDLGRLRAHFERTGVAVTDARVMLIVKLRCDLTVARDGRVLIKTRDANEARLLWAEVQPVLASCPQV